MSILGGLNLFLFGAASFLLSFILYVNSDSSNTQGVLLELRRYFPEEALGPQQLKSIFAVHMGVAAFFAVTGFGLIRKKEWARRFTLYFSFLAVILIFIAAATNSAFISQALVQAIYPAVLIIYFTNKTVEQYFVPPKAEKAEADNNQSH